MKNILATSTAASRFGELSWLSVAIGTALLAAVGWGAWMTNKMVSLERREIVTVQLAQVMGDFVEAEARAGRPPEETQARVAAYLKAVEASVAALGKSGRTVLVAEAVVAGSVPDLTEQVRAEVARRTGGSERVQR